MAAENFILLVDVVWDDEEGAWNLILIYIYK